MTKSPAPTRPTEEADKGHIVLWLDPADIAWLASRCDCPPDAAPEVTERCMRVRFRASAALHKAGLKN